MKLKLFDTMSNELVLFSPMDENRITMYACGPTVYSYAHVGNARASVLPDVLYRLLRHIYGDDNVVYAQNITDMDDKINAAALNQNVSISSITEKFTSIYFDNMRSIGNLTPNLSPRATDHMQDMIEMIEILIQSGHAYKSEGHVLFDVSSYDSYGKLSGRDKSDLMSVARVEEASYKLNPEDFVLWKPNKDGEPYWESSFGQGRAGWHIECSAMISAVLDETIDIHCGGKDLKFPHHDNEIAQSYCAHNKNLSNYWIHNGFISMGKDKMSKSLGNIETIESVLKKHHGEVIRSALMSAHYRSDLQWTDKLLNQMRSLLDGLYRVMVDIDEHDCGVDKDFMDMMLNDLDTASAMKHLVFISKNNPSKLKSSANLIGLLRVEPLEWFQLGVDSQRVNKLIKERTIAREEKDWVKADLIRDELNSMNVEIEDSDGNNFWKVIR